MPVGAKDKRTMAMAITALSALLLIFGVVPVLNVGVSTPIFAGFTFGTLLGVGLAYVAYLMHKNQV